MKTMRFFHSTIKTTLISSLMIIVSFSSFAFSQDALPEWVTSPTVTLRVDGLACPFCAYGLEKKLQKIKEIEKVEIDLNSGKVQLTLQAGAKLSTAELKKKINEAGFTLREIFPGNTADSRPTKSQAMLRIENVKSDSAVIRIKSAMSAFPCARLIAVDTSSGEALIECREDVRHQNQLLNSLQQAGFRGRWERKE